MHTHTHTGGRACIAVLLVLTGWNSFSTRCDNERGECTVGPIADPYHSPYQLRLPWVCCFKQIPVLPIAVTTLPLLLTCVCVHGVIQCVSTKSVSSDRVGQMHLWMFVLEQFRDLWLYLELHGRKIIQHYLMSCFSWPIHCSHISLSSMYETYISLNAHLQQQGL